MFLELNHLNHLSLIPGSQPLQVDSTDKQTIVKLRVRVRVKVKVKVKSQKSNVKTRP